MKIRIFLTILGLSLLMPNTSFTEEGEKKFFRTKPGIFGDKFKNKENGNRVPEELKLASRKDGINFYTGMFDFSDDKKRSTLFGIEHQDESLYKNTFFGRVTPVTGMMFTTDNAAYVYTGIEANYDLGPFKFTPSFTPGLYSQGNGKDLGHPLEFKSEVQLSMDLGESTNFGMSYNHVSNASLGDKNPGANSYMFNFLKQF
tara:strand:- start:2634 stop:3236 length:603 start_codon:yes stop_codon:yes gene_type:complete